ncbi:MAG: hypothetical protein M3O02_00680 [Acidobacteriota bacterium]|nr:hypothetical protein [Acidobacteriota bacterium]
MTPTKGAGRLHVALLPVLALIPVLPLALHGCSCGHDFDFHLMSWLDAAGQLLHGNIHPQWAFSPAYNAGEPRFVFYPPLSWYLGAAIGLVLRVLPGVSEKAAWSAAPIVFTWFALTLSGWTMYRLVRRFAGAGASLVAATLYLANPYMLFTAYERTAYAELLAAAWLPLLVQSVLQRRPSIPALALPLALLWLTNAPAAVIGTYSMALLALLRLAMPTRLSNPAGSASATAAATAQNQSRGLRSRRPLARWIPYLRPRLHFALVILAGTGLGLLLAAFYIVPAAYERRYVQIAMAIIPHLRIQDNVLFHHFTGPDAVFHNQVLHTASLIAVLLWTCAAALLVGNFVLCKRQAPSSAAPRISIAPLGVLLAVIGFLLTRWSPPIWNHLPEAAFLQFPWRSLSIVAVVLALSFGGLAARVRGTPALAIIAAVGMGALLTVPAYTSFRQVCEPGLAPSARLAAFQSGRGVDPTDEYTPVTADNDALTAGDPPYWLAASPTAAPPPGAAPGRAPSELTLRLPKATDLILNLRDYPAWSISLDGAPDLQRLGRDDGLIALPLPAGISTIELRYTHLPDSKIGDILTLLGIGLLAASVIPARWRARNVSIQSSFASRGENEDVSDE